jgi:acid phosphatase
MNREYRFRQGGGAQYVKSACSQNAPSGSCGRVRKGHVFSMFRAVLLTNRHSSFAVVSPAIGIVARMTFRTIGTGLCLLLPALAWTACSSDAENNPGGAGAGEAGEGGASAGKGGASGGKPGAGAGGSVAGGSVAGGSAEAGVPSEAGSSGEPGTVGDGGEGGEPTTAPPVDPLTSDVDTVVFIYAENRSFDGLYGNFPGAHGLSEIIDANGVVTDKYIPQKDRDGTTVLPTLPKTWGGVTAPGNATVVAEALTGGLPNKPYAIENAFIPAAGPGAALTTADVTQDMAHRFFENIEEINGGTNDMFGAWVNAGGLTMGHFDYSASAMYKLAKDYVLADNFFEGAYGGSFLNHQYLICACAPAAPASFVASNLPSLNVLGAPNAKGVPQLASNAASPASALDGAPSQKTGNIAPLDYFGEGDGYRAVNTMQAPYQPSGNTPVANALDLRYANAAASTTLPPQTQTTLGDELTAKGVSWAWYATAWDAATADGMQASTTARAVIYTPSTPKAGPDFQPHHHPYNYYAAFDPAAHAAARTEHLRDYSKLLTDITAGTLPHVVYYKPTGNVNQHPGYANVDDGDAHIADLVTKLKAGAQWAHMVIVITYDEYGGQWDHVSPPKADKLGPGTRIPALIISPYAKAGTVDHTQLDTGSLSRLVTRRYGLTPLPGLVARDQALVANNGAAMGDLTSALSLP